MVTMTVWQRMKSWARALKGDIATLWLAAHSPRVPWHAKAVAAATVAYALSPIDLIPDFIPLLGYLDDLVIVPLGIFLAVRLIPADILSDLRREAGSTERLPASRAGMVAIVLIWLGAAAVFALWFASIL
jgi:uncharacterized membrane protein YkvA (DUF1232 family)